MKKIPFFAIHNRSWWTSFIVLFGLCLGLTACQTYKTVQPLQTKPSCLPPSGVNLEQAMEQARNDLTHSECQVLFDDYFQALVQIATGDPKPENKRQFSDFLVWAHESGLMTRVQAETYYNRSFNDTFMALPDRYNVCSACQNKEDILSEMQAELQQKEQGLLEACRDKETYYQAARTYTELKDIFEATCLACSQN